MSAVPAPPPPALPPLYHRTDHWFQRTSAALLSQLPCRLGCTRCCIGPFPITILDAQILQDGLALMDSEHRRLIEQRAHVQTAAMEAAAPKLLQTVLLDDWADAEVDRLVEQFRDVPCPALESDGRCAVYAHRPLVCRSMGIPTDDQGLTQGACEVQTFIPIRPVPPPLRKEEDRLAQEEAATLNALRRSAGIQGEEILLPYGFVTKLHR